MAPIKYVTILLVLFFFSCNNPTTFNNQLKFKKLSLKSAPSLKIRDKSFSQIIQIEGHSLYVAPVIFQDRLKNILEKNSKFILYKIVSEGRTIYIYEFTKGETSFVFPEPVLQFDVTTQLLKNFSSILYERVDYLTNY